MSELVSIIVPCYNQSEYLAECLESIQNQTYTNWECIIINDGSTDNTDDIAKLWLQKDKRFKYFSRKNHGVANSRNFGIANANGEWILPLDGDDKIGLQYVELAAKHFEKNPRLIVCNFKKFGEIDQEFDVIDFDYKQLLIINSYHNSVFFRKSDFLLTTGFDEKMTGYEDWDFLIGFLDNNSQVVKLNYTGLYYRIKKQSRNKVINDSITVSNEMKNYIVYKNFEKYAKNFPSYIDVILENNMRKSNEHIVKQYDVIIKKIRKNTVTKMLFKAIEKLN